MARRSFFDWLRPTPLSRIVALPSFALPRTLAGVLGIPFIQNLLDLFPPFLLAVPKKKVSHSRKSMRSANKGLKDKTNIVNCQACGAPKLVHHLCAQCYSRLSRGWKAQDREVLDGNGVERMEAGV